MQPDQEEPRTVVVHAVDTGVRRAPVVTLVVVVATLVIAIAAVAVVYAPRRPDALPAAAAATATIMPTTLPSSPAATATPASPASRYRSTTSFGTIDWQRSDPGRQLDVIRTLEGNLLASDHETTSWWESADGLAWSETELPGGLAWEYMEAAGQPFAVITGVSGGTMMGPQSHREVIAKEWEDRPDDAAVLRKVGDDWEPIALPSTTPADIAGLVWHGPDLHGAAALSASDWVVPAVYFHEVPWRKILDAPAGTASAVKGDDVWPFWDEPNEQLQVYPSGRWRTQEPLARLHVAPSSDGSVIEFRDVDSGDLIHHIPATLPGWTPEALVRALRFWGLVDASFIVSHDGDLSVVRPPWAKGEEWTDGIVTFDGAYYTISLPLGRGYLAETIHLWTSRDGLSWESVDLPSGMTARLDHADLISGPRGLVMLINGVGTDRSVWASPDGRTWERGDDDPDEMATPWPGTFGWVMGSRISPDGRHWEPLDLPDLRREFLEPQAFGDLLVYGPGYDPGPGGRSGRVMWIGRMGRDGSLNHHSTSAKSSS